MAKLTTEQRKALPESDFAVPGTRDLPIHDADHVKMAWKMVDRTKGLSEAQRKEARRRIKERAHKLGIDTSDWNTLTAMSFEAMSLDVPATPDHPNKLPFSGVLTKVDELSDKPPGGSGGKLVYITKEAAEAAIPTILSMAVDVAAGFSGHDKQNKIGVITAAEIIDNDFRISGYLYASDFPDEVAYIQAHKDDLGFSYEVKSAEVASLDDDFLTVVGLTFSGAAILKKKDAAYTSTSLSAHADVETDMTKEELQAFLKPINDQIASLSASVAEALKKPEPKTLDAGSVAHLVKPHSDAIRAAAEGMEKAGIGMHEKGGHVSRLRAMADDMDAEAVKGKLPHIYNSGNDYYAGASKELQAAADKHAADMKVLTDGLDALKTKLVDLEAKAFTEVKAPERKTLPASIQALVEKGHLKLDASKADEKISASDLDKAMTAAGINSVSQRIAFKTELAASGRLA